MRLTEAEGKTLLKESGINVPGFLLLKENEQFSGGVEFPVMVKAQTLSGGRGKAGLVKIAASAAEVEVSVAAIWKARYEKRPFENILIEPKFYARKEYYLSMAFDTSVRGPVLVLSKFGGMDIETVAKRQPSAVVKTAIDPLQGISGLDVPAVLQEAGIKEELWEQFESTVSNLYEVFVKNDAELVEINPLLETEAGQLIAADCKMIIDDAALYRHEFPFERRTGYRPLTEMEKAAREIDSRSHRGVVGRTLLELDGDIAVMSSGGGASITCLDALINYGGRPATFAEYSGNPEREDVRDLTKLIMGKVGLRALWVVGGRANFTDIFETLAGVIDAVKEMKPTFPIVIRRAGPRDDEAKDLILKTAQETGLDITFYGEEVSMTESAGLLMEKVGPSPEVKRKK